MSEKNSVTVKIMGKIYNVACPADRVSELNEAAEFLDNKLNEIHDKDKIMNIDAFMMFALNLVHEHLAVEKQNLFNIKEMNGEINNLHNMIADALSTENVS